MSVMSIRPSFYIIQQIDLKFCILCSYNMNLCIWFLIFAESDLVHIFSTSMIRFIRNHAECFFHDLKMCV